MREDSFAREMWVQIRINDETNQKEVLFVQPAGSPVLIIPGVRLLPGLMMECDPRELLIPKLRLDLNVSLEFNKMTRYTDFKAPAYNQDPKVERMVENIAYFACWEGELKTTQQIYEIKHFPYVSDFVQGVDEKHGSITSVDRALMERLHTDGHLT